MRYGHLLLSSNLICFFKRLEQLFLANLLYLLAPSAPQVMVYNRVTIPTMDLFAKLINRTTGDSTHHISQYLHQYLRTYPNSAKLRLPRFFHGMELEILRRIKH